MHHQQAKIRLGFSDQGFPAGTHMCLIYGNDRERRRIIRKFIQVGILEGENIGYFADRATPEDIEEWLEFMGIETTGATLGHQLRLAPAESTYCPDGTFNPETMLDSLKAFYRETVDQGCHGCRVSGEMSWALKGIPGSERLMEYESRVNEVVKTHPVTAICQYDANRFDGATLLECLEVHPYMIVRGQIVHNPYYLDTKAFLEKKRQKH